MHGLMAMSAQAAPTSAAPFSRVDATTWSLHTLVALSGTTFMAITSNNIANSSAQDILWKVYELWTDHVLKNPFQQEDNVIRVPEFARQVQAL